MLKAQSAECRTKTPLNEHERFRLKQKAWTDDRTLLLTKGQIDQLSKEHKLAIEIIGAMLYGK